MKVAQVLLVEGCDDQHVIWALLAARNVPKVFAVEQKNGIDNLLRVLPVQIKGSSINSVGIVVDADANIAARWQSIRSILTLSGYTSVPTDPDINGTVVSEVGLPTVGVWLMPDNVLAGMLEDFVGKLVPEGDVCFAHAQQVTDNLPSGVKQYRPGHSAKACIHTWLAWQSDPGTPLGLALTKKYLNATAPSATSFVGWLGRLFSLPDIEEKKGDVRNGIIVDGPIVCLR